MAFYEDDLDIIFSDFAEDVVYAAQPKLPQDGATIRGYSTTGGRMLPYSTGR